MKGERYTCHIPMAVRHALPFLIFLACSSASHEAPVQRPEAPVEAPEPAALPIQTSTAAPHTLAAQAEPTKPAVERSDASDAEWAAEIGDPRQSTSRGSPTNGSLEGGVVLPKQGVGF